MTRFTLKGCWFVEKDPLALHNFEKAMALVTSDSLVATFQRKLRFAVVEGRRLPALGIVAVGAFRLLGFGELFRMNVRVARLTGHGSPFKLDLLFPGKGFVTCVASYGAMDAN